MSVEFIKTGIESVTLVRPQVHGDDRGRFVEIYRHEWLSLRAMQEVQVNRSVKRAGALVGLHFHLKQTDYWYLLAGKARVVLHDLRQDSPTDGKTLALDFDDERDQGVVIPPGVAHGFYAVTDMTLLYVIDRYYDPSDELGVAWDDPEIDASWPTTKPTLSKRDQTNPLRFQLDRPRYSP